MQSTSERATDRRTKRQADKHKIGEQKNWCKEQNEAKE